jgi:hypothetical protein
MFLNCEVKISAKPTIYFQKSIMHPANKVVLAFFDDYQMGQFFLALYSGICTLLLIIWDSLSLFAVSYVSF